jgi:tetratricopeptide (TPR) repeat protein
LEQQYPVPPLPEGDAISLFGERARAVRPDFAFNGAVAEICRRLDGLPLAIELAAALVKLLPPDALLERLEQRLALLTGGARDLPERQKTLRATIEWSFELLDPREQELMAQLSVFAGGWSLEAAEAVCNAELRTLAALVDKSLVRERAGRFSMLETIREYALERLAEHDPEEDSARGHSAYFLTAAEARAACVAITVLQSETVSFLINIDLQRDVVDWFEAEQDNLRAALDWFHDQPEPAPELRLAVACSRFWYHGGYWTEARRRLEDALARAGGMVPELRVRALVAASNFSWRQGDFEGGKAFTEEAHALVAQHAVSGSLAASISLAICEAGLGDRQRAIQLYESALSQARADGDDLVSALVLGNLGNMALDERDLVSARTYLEESAVMHRRLGQQGFTANNLIDLGFIALAENRRDAAAAALRESLRLCRAERIAELLLLAVEGLAALSLDRGDAVEAVRLLAATTRPRAELGVASSYYPIGEEMRERTLQAAREQLGGAAFAKVWEEGEGLSLEEAGEAASRI